MMMTSREHSKLTMRVAGDMDKNNNADEFEYDYDDFSESGKVPYEETNASVQNDRYSNEIVRLACIRGDLDKLKEYLPKDITEDINDVVFESGENPLLLACLGGNLSVIKYLLQEKYANPNWRHPVSKVTCLMVIVLSKREEQEIVHCAAVLIESGADVNAQDEGGRSALLFASKVGLIGLMNFLMQKGANPNLSDHHGHTALFLAAETGNGRTCTLLLEGGADIFAVDRGGWMVADYAQRRGFPRVASTLYAIQCQCTNWKPVMDKSLLDELGNVVEEKKPMKLVEARGKLSEIMSAAKAEKFLDNFKKKRITFQQFLNFNHEKLRKIGVNEIGTRIRITDMIKLAHSAEWQRSSIHRFERNAKFSAAEHHCMLLNINMHFERIIDTLTYIKTQIQSRPMDTSTQKGRQRVECIYSQCLQLEIAASRLTKQSRKLHGLLERIYDGNQSLQIAGLIGPRTLDDVKEKKTFCRGWWFIAAGCASVILMKIGRNWGFGKCVWNTS